VFVSGKMWALTGSADKEMGCRRSLRMMTRELGKIDPHGKDDTSQRYDRHCHDRKLGQVSRQTA